MKEVSKDLYQIIINKITRIDLTFVIPIQTKMHFAGFY